MQILRSLLLLIIGMILTRPALGNLGRYSIPFEQVIRPQLNLPPDADRLTIRTALEKYLATTQLPDAVRYSGQRQLLFYLEFSDREAFHRLRLQVEPKVDDYLLLTSYVLYDATLDYPQLVERLEHYFEMAQKLEPGTDVAGWIAHDTLAVMTDNYDFGKASLLVHKAIATLPESSWFLRAQLLGTIARLYVDPGNSPAIVRQGLAIYAENEKRMRMQGRLAAASDSAYNQGIGVLFAFGDDQKALEHFARVSPESVYVQDALVFSALAHAHLGQQQEARASLRQVSFINYPESPMRVAFLRCYGEIVRQLLGEKANLKLCVTLPDATQLDVIQHMTQEILQLAPSPAIETAVLKQFQHFYRQKIRPENKKRMARSVDGLELARARAESDRSRYESQISRMELDLAQKKSQLTVSLAASSMALLGLASFGFWRRQVQQQRMQNLQQYLQTRILSRFLPPALVEEIRLGRSRLDEEPQKRMVTILFADLVDFTSRAEQLGPERTARLLNQWMHMATDVVFAESGTIDKFIGDCVMVIFGAPLESAPDKQVERAVACARHLMRAMEGQNQVWLRDFGVSFQLRVGINLGEAIVGSFGSEKRSDYTVIGGAVNLASRIESMAEPGQILLGQNAARHLSSSQVAALGARAVRGMKGTHELFQLHRDELSPASLGA
ncbi:adenylate/guanylate cyclase domain-containing protein [Oligoflexus tunisiensis]|uniref:adenylate/guanylate cyclase domain-containing protein n=1 Tax=Oligoflexus tunisiensis TaxID=708132 RepID=UPI000B2CD585|nr:adenylate/guanylate cyclase domain-containing protein [Oligoflexus tunisiensis]